MMVPPDACWREHEFMHPDCRPGSDTAVRVCDIQMLRVTRL